MRNALGHAGKSRINPAWPEIDMSAPSILNHAMGRNPHTTLGPFFAPVLLSGENYANRAKRHISQMQAETAFELACADAALDFGTNISKVKTPFS